MALAISSVIDKYFDGKRGHVIVGITASGNYTTGGDTLSLAGLIPGSATIPTWGEITSVAGYVYSYVNGTTQANGKMKVFVATTTGANIPLAEHTAAAYAAGVTGDTIVGYFEFKVR